MLRSLQLLLLRLRRLRRRLLLLRPLHLLMKSCRLFPRIIENLCVCVCVRVCVCVSTRALMRVCARIHTHERTYYTHVHMLTHLQLSSTLHPHLVDVLDSEFNLIFFHSAFLEG